MTQQTACKNMSDIELALFAIRRLMLNDRSTDDAIIAEINHRLYEGVFGDIVLNCNISALVEQVNELRKLRQCNE